MTIAEYIATIKNEQSIKDAHTLAQMMQQISNSEPKIWDMGSIGFDSYHYKYDSGREGDAFIIGFRPSKAKMTIYLMDGTIRYAEQLQKLGKHTTTGYCLYIKQLSDIDLGVLNQILQKSYANIKSQDGNVTEILWKKA